MKHTDEFVINDVVYIADNKDILYFISSIINDNSKRYYCLSKLWDKSLNTLDNINDLSDDIKESKVKERIDDLVFVGIWDKKQVFFKILNHCCQQISLLMSAVGSCKNVENSESTEVDNSRQNKFDERFNALATTLNKSIKTVIGLMALIARLI